MGKYSLRKKSEFKYYRGVMLLEDIQFGYGKGSYAARNGSIF